MENRFLPSFSRRKARKLRTASQRAYDEKLSLVNISLGDPLFEPLPQEIWLEIGFGGGEHLLTQLSQNPTVSIVGCEPFINGVAKLLVHLPEENLPRVRLWTKDSRYFLDKTSSSYFSRAFILFPDPWPKVRQHKRRLITPHFITQLARTLKEGALLRIASDDPSYVKQILEVLLASPSFQHIDGPTTPAPFTWSPRPDEWPSTRYEQKALSQGKPCAYMTFQKKGG